MATSWKSQQGNGVYALQFETDNLEKYKFVEKSAQMAVDGKTTADVAEVRHGEWIEWWDDNYLSYCHKCSECGGYPLTKEETMHDEVLSAYCPECGARMDGGKNENV